MPGALYTIGNFTIDDIVLWPGGGTWMGQAGGNVLFSALGARIWLDTVGMLARIGNDYPAGRLGEIERRGIVVDVHHVDVPNLHDWALYEAQGARQFVNHLSSGTNEAMTITPEEIPARCRDGLAYHIASAPAPQQIALVAALKRPGRFISLDPHELWVVEHADAIRAALTGVDFFLPSEIEARLLYGSDAPERAAREFGQLGPKVVVIKMGEEGSLVYETAGDRLTQVPAYPAQVQDVTGAGDAYCGGFLAGYVITSDAIAAAQHGTVSASYVAEAVGALATAQPTRAEARERLHAVAAQTVRSDEI
ncbi:MAG: hypothetical protein H0W08_22605 [Acidobacteria bacterium]|nr:hypothetical protein [Acidobacteriota bacterium]